MRTTIIFVLAALVAGLPGEALAQANNGVLKKSGTTGLPLLELAFSPRTTGRADIRVLDIFGVDAMFANPAGLGPIHGPATQVLVGNMQYLAETQIQSAAISRRFGTLGAVGISVASLDYGTMQGTRNLGQGASGNYEVTDPFTSQALTAGVTVARQLTDRFSFGMTGRYAQERIATYTASAMAFDIGMLYDTGFRSLRIGGLVQNFGAEAQFVANPFKLPTTLRLAAAMNAIEPGQAIGRVTLHVEAVQPNNGSQQLHTALEFAPISLITFRGGYAFGLDEGGLALGGSFDLMDGRLAFDAAYTDFGRLGSTLGIGLRAGF